MGSGVCFWREASDRPTTPTDTGPQEDYAIGQPFGRGFRVGLVKMALALGFRVGVQQRHGRRFLLPPSNVLSVLYQTSLILKQTPKVSILEGPGIDSGSGRTSGPKRLPSGCF